MFKKKKIIIIPSTTLETNVGVDSIIHFNKIPFTRVNCIRKLKPRFV